MMTHLTIGFILTLKLTTMLCEFDLWTVKTQPCDIHENVTTNTVKFYCRGRLLRAVPQFEANTTHIDLTENRIGNLTSKAFKGLVNLTELYLNWLNQNKEVIFSAGVFSNLTKLQTLELNGNRLKALPDDLPKNIFTLKLVENRITWINSTTFAHIKNLSTLYLSKNCYYWNPCSQEYQVDDDSFSALTNLKKLKMSYNNLTQVPKGLPVSLTFLELCSNRIEQIGEHDFQGLRNLTSLKIQGNCPRCNNAPYPCTPCKNVSIDIHPQAFSELEKLQTLHLAGNSIMTINPEWFTNISNLRELFLSFNFLFKAITNEDGKVFLNNLPLLTKLDLSFNYELQRYPSSIKLSPAFANLTSLKSLHLVGLVFQEILNDTFDSLERLQNLTLLDVGTNFIVRASSNIFRHVRVIYLSENRLYPVTINGEGNQKQAAGLKASLPIPFMSEPHSKDMSYDLPRYLVKPECYAYGRVLDLSRNNLFLISPKQFQTFGNISCLNLSGNGFSTAPNGSEFTYLPDVKYLDLSFNRIDLAYDNAFRELQSLEVLDLSYNTHYFTVPGVTHKFNFLKNLPSLKVLNISYNRIYTLTTKSLESQSLQELQFKGNNLGKMWRVKDNTYKDIFTNLTNLTRLELSDNMIGKIQRDIFDSLPTSIQHFGLSYNKLVRLDWIKLRRFTNLQVLILSYNLFSEISGNLSSDLPSLRKLDLQHNQIIRLTSGFLQGAVNLELLDLSHNGLATVNQSTFPMKSHMTRLWLHGNPFHCTCDLLEFVLWILKTNVKIPKLVTGVTCALPEERKGQAVVHFDIKECIDDQLTFVVYFFTSMFIILITFLALAMHLFYWDISYLFYYWKAKVSGYQQLSAESFVYDAFVTYDTKDPQVSDWVLNHLREHLENRGERFVPICLEERDWIPGCPMVDNLTQSIQHSRKTVFVLTEGYVTSGSFKLALFLAHQRLLEDNEDVIVLLLLEPVLQHSHFLRLRKRLCARSVLEWPCSSSAEAWFWQSLKNAIRLDNQAMYSQLYSRYFTTK